MKAHGGMLPEKKIAAAGSMKRGRHAGQLLLAGTSVADSVAVLNFTEVGPFSNLSVRASAGNTRR